MDIDGHVLVIGAAGIDVKGIPASPLVVGESIPGRVRRSFGGVARNVAENLARLEVETILLTALGMDASADQILHHCETSGIIMRHIKRCSDARSGFYLSIMDEEGDPIYAVSDYDIMKFLDIPYLKAQHALFDDAQMIMLDLNIPSESLECVFDLAEEYEVPVAVDPTSAAKASRLRPYLDRVHLVTPNAAETTVLCGLEVSTQDQNSAVKAAHHLITMGTDIAIVTLGERGLAYADASGTGHIPAVTTHVVDSTGAGDALTAGVIFGLIQDMPLDEAIRLGVTAASLTLQCEESVAPHLSPDLLYDSLVI